MVRQNPPTPFELNAWVPAPDFPPPFTGPVPVHHQGARQPGAPQGLSPVPASSDDEALAWLGEELVRRRIQEPALPSAAHLPVQSFGEERLLGSAADRADEDGAPAKRQSTLNNPPEIAVQGLLSESGNSGARVLMQAATSLRPAINEAQIRRGRLNNPDAPKKDLDGFKRPADRTQNSTLVTVGSDKRALFSQDASLIEVLESAFRKGKVAETTFRLNVNPLLQFARWLVDSGKQGFATRLDETTLKQDLKQYERSGGPSLEAPMRHLKTAEAGGVPIAGHALRNPYAQDEALIKLYNATPSAKNADRDRVMRYTSALKRFSDYLQKNGKMGIAARLNDKTLDDDAKLHPGGYIGIHAALVQLRKSGAGELGFEGHIAPVLRDDAHFAPAHPARVRSGTFGGLQSFVDLNAPTPSDLRDDAHFAPAAPARARSGTFGGLQSFVDLNAPTPSDLRDDAHFAPAAPARARSGTFGGLQSFVDLNAPTPSDLRDDAHFAPAAPARARSGTFGGLQSFVDLNAPTPSDLRDDAHSAPVRPREQMLRETEWQPMMQATGSAAVFRPGGPDDVRLIHRGRLSPMSEAAPAPLARAPQPAPSATARLPETYRGLPVVDLTRPTTTSSDAQIGALDPAASSKVPNGSVLGADEWLSDAHILRDYHLLEERLRGINPTLAGQTRLVDPLIANGPLRLRSSSEIDRLYALQRILYDHNGNDTADFLFLPVNNATEHNLGTHWSLLLVDRRNRERPVAYHYDSLQRKGYNDMPATQLARLLNATLMPARMPPQGNDYDCGVFVVDGTWALVGRLLDGERPDHEPLHLDNLVADRQALQDRLRGRLPHEEETGELRLLLDDQPASPQMIAFGPAELWQLLDDEPAASSPRSSSTPDAGRDSVHEPAKAPWLPRSQG
ncbi:hypothetical protein BPNPMPFG_008089 (plasmid) [Mesorhizobium sp. AR07]|nr:hypothetical protein BPNPMPFG_008089 [Mesorhizobium sp. AR07]